MLLIILNVNGLNTPVKRQSLDWIKNTLASTCKWSWSSTSHHIHKLTKVDQ